MQLTGHKTRAALLDGEIVCLAEDGRSKFYDLLFRREWPHFIAFDVLSIDGEDLRDCPLLERKRRLRALMPRPEAQTRVLYHDHIDGRGRALFDAVRGQDSRASSRSGSAAGITPMARRPSG
jgi:bifunctional non-homologous end joining protein LigD